MKNLEATKDLITSRLDEQIRSIDSFTTKAGLVLAATGVVFAAYVQFFTSTDRPCNTTFFLFEVLSLFGSSYFAFKALSLGGESGTWRYDPNPEIVLRKFREKKNDDDFNITEDVLEGMVESYKHNRALFKEKYQHLVFSRYALYISGVIFILNLLVYYEIR